MCYQSVHRAPNLLLSMSFFNEISNKVAKLKAAKLKVAIMAVPVFTFSSAIWLVTSKGHDEEPY